MTEPLQIWYTFYGKKYVVYVIYSNDMKVYFKSFENILDAMLEIAGKDLRTVCSAENSGPFIDDSELLWSISETKDASFSYLNQITA